MLRRRKKESWVDHGSEQHALPLTQPAAAPYVYAALLPARPSHVFDTYWKFAAERQEIFFRRCRGGAPPWTDDPILQHFKFTNAYRAADRVSQFLLRYVLYQGTQTPREIFFRAILFKLFNKISTWLTLQSALGTLTAETLDIDRYDRVLCDAMSRGERIYSGAYIMPSGGRDRAARKHRTHLGLLRQMLEDDLPERLAESRTMRECFEKLRTYPMMGDFLSYQYVIDLNYSVMLNFSEMEFVVPGPGARGGIRKCFQSLGGLSEIDAIRLVTESQESEFARLGLEFKSLWGRPLNLIDCQNLFCEVDKYARRAHPEVMGIAARTRIKQVFRSQGEAIDYWFPPKWGLNQRIAQLKGEDLHARI
jgi:hypothetical protein